MSRLVRLGDLVSLDKGISYSGKYLTDHGLPMVNLKNIERGGGFRQEGTKPYSGPHKARHCVAKGDLVLANTDLTQAGEIIGSPALVPSSIASGLISHHLFAVRIASAQVDRTFLYYRLRAPDFKAHARGRASGTTVLGLRADDTLDFKLELPAMSTQRRMAAVLAAYDQLIDNNLRRIEILEEMSRAVYRKWFVSFRFPGHEDVAMIDSPFGRMPDGWVLSDLGSSARWLSGGTPRTSESSYWGGSVPWITSGSLTSFLLDRSDRTLTEAGVEAGSKLVPRDTLLCVVRGMSLAKEFRHGIAEVPMAFGQDCKALIAEAPLEPLYLAYSVSIRAAEIQAMVEYAAHGTGKLSTDRLKALPLLHPPADLQKRFVERVGHMRSLMSNLRSQVDKLREALDLLLPRLVTGEIDVSDLDIDTEWLAS